MPVYSTVNIMDSSIFIKLKSWSTLIDVNQNELIIGIYPLMIMSNVDECLSNVDEPKNVYSVYFLDSKWFDAVSAA